MLSTQPERFQLCPRMHCVTPCHTLGTSPTGYQPVFTQPPMCRLADILPESMLLPVPHAHPQHLFLKPHQKLSCCEHMPVSWSDDAMTADPSFEGHGFDSAFPPRVKYHCT